MLSFTERLSRDVARAARMTLPQLEQALAESDDRTVSQLTALSLAKKAAEGATDALKMIRELTKWEATKGEPTKEAAGKTAVEFRVVLPQEKN